MKNSVYKEREIPFWSKTYRPRGEQEKGDEKTGPCALDFRQQNDYILLMYGI